MRVLPLASGSRGNATLVEIGAGRGLFGPTRLLVDAGLSARELTRRLRQAGVDPRSIAALLLSHEHDDHARGAELFSRLHGVPVLCARETLAALDRTERHFSGWRPLVTGRTERIDGVDVQVFPVPHDAAAPVGFVIAGDGRRCGIATDLGHVTPLVVDSLRGCDLLLVEFNHDDRMLQGGPYPLQVKRRVAGGLGHLSNREAAALLRLSAVDGCRVVVLAHLSETNNTPELAERSARAAVGRKGPEIRVAAPGGASAPLVLGEA
jgi:phosphoribosyl 1,2-cyclic phosphodiesterase